MSEHDINDRTLAFAAVLQALKLVQDSARGRPCDLSAMQASVGSILALDADSVMEIFGGVGPLRTGLDLLKTQLVTEQRRPDAELSRYLVTLLHLERKLSKRADLLDRLRTGIERAQRQAEHFDIVHDNVIASLADLYTGTVSTLSPRIMVSGQPERLSDSLVANRVRALLLAAMRAAVLWRQCGGSRLGLLFERKKMVRTASNLLEGSVNP